MVKETEIELGEFRYVCDLCFTQYDGFEAAMKCEKNCRRGVKNGRRTANL